MPFDVKFDAKAEDVNREETKIIVPVSMDQKSHTGERLIALVRSLDKCNVTFLIADALQRHNTGSEKQALKMGEKFLKKNETIFKEAVIIDSAEAWQLHRDKSEMKIVFWKVWIAIKEKEMSFAEKIVEEATQPGMPLRETIETVAKTFPYARSAESCINFQKEEITYLLTFSDFDLHIYPKKLHNSQIKAHEIFSVRGFKLPHLVTAELLRTPDASYVISESSFFKENKKKSNSLPLPLRLLLQNVETIIESPEVSEQTKSRFAENLSAILESYSRNSPEAGVFLNHPSAHDSNRYQTNSAS